MLAIDDTLVSDNIYRIKFHCDLERCFGACCVEGDAGAPLEDSEIELIRENLPVIREYMRPEGIEKVEQEGVFEKDPLGTPVTPLVNRRECAFVYFEGEIARCAIEKSWQEGRQPFQKPVSCHLYPVRIRRYRDSQAVNYHEWHVCHPARIKGGIENIPLYVFLKDSLLRRYGQKWYDELVEQIGTR